MIYEYSEPATGSHTCEKAEPLSRSMPGIPCTGCGKCRGCPMELDIPEIFAAMNAYYASGNPEKLEVILAMPGDQQPRGCVGCGACMAQCPEHIDISGIMLKVASQLRELEK